MLGASNYSYMRQEQAKPALVELHAWLAAASKTVAAGSGTAKAIDYALRRWPALLRHADNVSMVMPRMSRPRDTIWESIFPSEKIEKVSTMAFDDELTQMKDAVAAAQDEIVMAVMFHETWKPTAYDEDLHKRMGNSFATHSFQIVRLSLRREMLLALMRLWDTNRSALRMTAIAEKLRTKEFFDALVTKRADGTGLSSNYVVQSMREALEPKRKAVLKLVRKYSEGGIGYPVFEKLRALRHERLAHRQAIQTSVTRADANDQEIESFYEDNLELVRLLLSLVLATAFDLTEAADVYRHHAKFFWANARGERTEGHPNYRPRI